MFKSFEDVIAAENARREAFAADRKSVMDSILSGHMDPKQISRIPLQYLDVTQLPGVPAENVLTPSKAYKPFRYDLGHEIYERQNKVHWLRDEIPLNEDVVDWKVKLTPFDRSLAGNIFPLFVQNDFLVQNAYLHQYARIFLPNEFQMAFAAIANMEAIHQDAYANLIDTLGLSDRTYTAFMEYKEMIDKYDYTAGFKMDTLEGIAFAMYVFGCLTEGVQLLGSFSMLFNFSRFNKLKGMGQVVSFSVRDEMLHVECIGRLSKFYLGEFGHLIDMDRFQTRADEITHKIIGLEDNYTDLAFQLGPVEGMNAQDSKSFTRSNTDIQRDKFGMKPLFPGIENPYASWVGGMMNGLEHANIFEQRGSNYSRGATRGEWKDAYDDPVVDPAVEA